MIPLAEGYDVRDATAMAARRRIDADIRNAEPRLRPALEYLRDHLFEPGLMVDDLQKASGIESARFYETFRQATGASPRAYFERFRLRTAAALLRETTLAVGEVAMLSGYVSLKSFRLRFRKRFGLPPVRYRRQNVERTVPPDDDISIEAPHWCAAFLTWAAADARDRATDVRTADDLEASAARRAEQAWAIARGLSERARRQLVAFVGRTTPALAEHLFEQSRVEGRGDRAWGVAVAKLAHDAIPQHTNDAWHGKSLCEARIRAHAWLGNAHGLLLDFSAAAGAFERARHLLAAAGTAPVSALARAELAWLEAGLEWIRSDYARAAVLADARRDHSRAPYRPGEVGCGSRAPTDQPPGARRGARRRRAPDRGERLLDARRPRGRGGHTSQYRLVRAGLRVSSVGRWLSRWPCSLRQRRWLRRSKNVSP